MKLKLFDKKAKNKNKSEVEEIKTDTAETEAAENTEDENSGAGSYVDENGRIQKKPELDMNMDVDDDDDDAPEPEKKGLAKLFGKKKPKRDYSFDEYPHLLAIRPHECYMFYSDYIRIDDDTYTCILAMFHNTGAVDHYGTFWGLNLLPHNLPKTTKVIRFEQVSRMSDEWVDEHQTRAEKVAEANASEQGRGGTNTTKRKAGRSMSDLDVIAQELLNGATYLHVHYRLQVISPTLAELDAAIDQIRKDYVDAFATLTLEPYQGEQKKEMSTLFRNNNMKLGTGYYYTSTEYAGSYNLVTHGIEDHDGEFVGHMTGDVNNSAVLFDIDYYPKHIVIADNVFDDRYKERVHRSNVWGSKIAQAALLNNHKVAHFLLSPVDMNMISPKFAGFTNFVDMTGGDLNMFELWGSTEDELVAFPKQLEKIKIMTEQISPPTDDDRTIIRGSLDEVLTQFYIDSRMWVANAQFNRDKLRLVGIPHDQVPKLEQLVMNLDQKHKALMAASVVDEEQVHAYGILKTIFRSMLTSNGDLFNTVTSDVFDTVTNKTRVIYDFSELLQRGKGIAMAQMINVIDYALSGLGAGDLAIFHGCDNIDSQDVKDYLKREFDFLYKRGGRTCLIYDDVTAYMQDLDFNEAIRADYTITSTMAPADADLYEKEFGIALPGSLKALVTAPHSVNNYLHRGVDNIVFKPDLYVGIKYDNDRKGA